MHAREEDFVRIQEEDTIHAPNRPSPMDGSFDEDILKDEMFKV